MQLAVNSGITDLRAIRDAYNSYAEGGELFKNGGKKKQPLVAPKRVRQNDSPTSEASTKLEDQMNRWVYSTNGKRGPNPDYVIPYLKDKEIKVKGVGRVPTNALDSIAKYAGIKGLPLYEALGLAAQETAFGAQPYYNYNSKVDGETISSRALGNSSYFRNFGVIPAENLVRDFRYNKPDWKGEYIDSNIPPLQHAFEYYMKGDYNRGDPNHTKDVRAKGKALMTDPAIQKWMKESKYVKKRGGPIYTSTAEVPPTIVTPDKDYNVFLNSLPDNQKYTPEEDYSTKRYWELHDKPKDFEEAKRLGMYTYDSSDNSYHANSVAWGKDGIGYFMKPKHHDTLKYELDWYNKGLITEEGGKQHKVKGKDKREWRNFRDNYILDTSGDFYRYLPKKNSKKYLVN